MLVGRVAYLGRFVRVSLLTIFKKKNHFTLLLRAHYS
ncbi:hypothetical protein BVRB_9g212160 [Beta vulgaris subsp. vulgaris]|nr:hypothetical protein BVRB_9g212160 [Beta vulgaris subsp. vulgaris]